MDKAQMPSHYSFLECFFSPLAVVPWRQVLGPGQAISSNSLTGWGVITCTRYGQSCMCCFHIHRECEAPCLHPYTLAKSSMYMLWVTLLLASLGYLSPSQSSPTAKWLHLDSIHEVIACLLHSVKYIWKVGHPRSMFFWLLLRPFFFVWIKTIH